MSKDQAAHNDSPEINAPQARSDNHAVRKIVIVGGGTSGWMSAAALCKVLESKKLDITLIESEAIGTVGVGEATLPHIRFFNQKLGIDEAELMRETQATYKLGIEFKDWGNIGQSYIHPFGAYGYEINKTPFHHYLTRAINAGQEVNLDAFSLPVMAARAGKFQAPHPDPDHIMGTFGYAFQFDAGLYAQYLRKFSEARGLTRIEGRIIDTTLRSSDGFIESVTLENGDIIEGDVFIDCSGFRGLLIEGALKTGYQSYTDYLPCNRAVTAGSENTAPPKPYTRATAKSSGWQWRIPLQHRTGNGYVYASDFISDDEATASLLADIDGPLINDPRVIRFSSGMRKKAWNKNCIAVGLSGGFLEPLESTGLYLIQEAITNFIELFPTRDCPAADRDEYNRIMELSFERVRDFLILHYVATKRDDSPFWDHCREMAIPDSLSHKMELFRSSGRIISYELGAFKFPSWVAVYYGQGIVPDNHSPIADHMPAAMLPEQLGAVQNSIRQAVDAMSEHNAYIAQQGAAQLG